MGRTPSTLSPGGPRSGSGLEEGDLIGRFVIEGTLGAGGMGVVYAAHDPQLGRKVAVKLLREPLPSTPARARLLREAQSMARLAHPNVVVVFDAGVVEDRVFVAMELVDGESMAEWLEKSRPEWRAVVDVFLAAGRGLAAAHAAGIVHRDFKPANVLIGRDGRPRVGDFGLAREAGEISGEALPSGLSDERLTQTGAIVGTPAYMSPEQRDGVVSPLSDQFSFCVALYEGLYRERPFMRGARELPPPPRGSPVPAAVRRVVARGLSRDPAERWPSIEALLEALATVARGRRATVLLAAGGAAGAVALATLLLTSSRHAAVPPRARPCAGIEQRLYGLWDAPRKTAMHAAFLATKAPGAEQRWRTVEGLVDAYAGEWVKKATDVCAATEIRHEQPPETRARRQSCLDQRLESLRAWAGVMAAPDARKVGAAGGSAAQLATLASCDEQIPFAMPEPADPALRAAVLGLRATLDAERARARVGDYADSQAIVTKLRESARALGYKPFLAEILSESVKIENNVGDPRKAEAFAIEVRKVAEETRYDMMRANAWVDLVWTYSNMYRTAEAHAAARDAEAILATMSGVDAEFSRAALAQFEANAYWSEHKLPEALALAERSVEIAARLLNPDDVRVATFLITQAGILEELGRYDEAEATFRRALGVVVAANGDSNMLAAGITMSLGNVANDRGDAAGALALYQKADAALEEVLGPLNIVTNENLCNLAHALIHLGRAEEAMAILPKVLEVVSDKRGAQHPETAEVLQTIGEAELGRGQPAAASAALERALTIRTGGADHDVNAIADTRFTLAKSLAAASRDRARARRLAEQARDGFDEAHAKDRAEADAWLRRKP